MKIAVVQFDSLPDKEANLNKVEWFLKQAVKRNIDLFCLPENFLCRTGKKEAYLTSESIPGPTSRLFSGWARKYRVNIHNGSCGERKRNSRKVYNTSLFFSKTGKILAKYRKVHLFDAKLPTGKVIRESEIVERGKDIVVKSIKYSSACVATGFSICFDLRFPEFYKKMTRKGAEILFIPSNFTYITGKVHWITLLRARAIENQSYVIAPGQTGKNRVTGVRSYGHSAVIDPWGKILVEGSTDKEEILYADIDIGMVKKVRERMIVR